MASLAEREAAAGRAPTLVSPGAPPAGFALNWALLGSWGRSTEPYLAQWSILDHFPAMAADVQLASLWPGRWRRRFPHVFIGPEHTVTGLHFYWNHNHYVQARRGRGSVVRAFAPA